MRPTIFTGTLGRLRCDKRGNTLAMAAASLIPICAMAGSGLDASRGYLAKARLQSACDAGALAARKVMDGSPALTPAASAAGQSFFENNFPDGTYASTNRQFQTQLNANMEVVGVARVRVPMTLMKMFNYDQMDLVVNCSARLDITNTDVMFVLDTTGSMDCNVSHSDCSGTSSSRKILGLRQAVGAFATTLSTNAPATARIRYGFVPYSSTVNVGALLQQSWVKSTHSYRSRVANFNTLVSPVTTTEEYVTPLTQAECAAYISNVNYPTRNGPSVSSTDPNGFTTTGSVTPHDNGAGGNSNAPTQRCKRYKTVAVSPAAYRFSGWTYGSFPYEASGFKAGAAVPVAMGDPPANYYVGAAQSTQRFNLTQLPALPNYAAMGGAVSSFAWDGCIEERNTVANATFTYGSIPSAAHDLDVDLPATNDDTSWRAKWPQITWHPTANAAYYGSSPGRTWDARDRGFYACPTAARKLETLTPAQVQTYADSLNPIGGTYHDTGMIWGARLISPTGIFGPENSTAPNNQPISRNIIFMTDGDMAPNEYIDGLYGVDHLDRRVSNGDFNSLTNRHNSRFVAMCNAIRAKNVRVYVIGFGSALNSQLTACADPGQAYFANDAATLRAKFTEIATKIAKLRLSQ